ncbi:MAG: SDR family oxidoreductase [Actinobacteria bacterium]|nr:SDR family oxidoreductase [Actinomycetota bacterium]
METKTPTLVTGAGGCIGAWTIRQLLAEEVPVLALDLHRDDRRLRLLVDPEELERVTWIEADVTDLAALRRTLEEGEVGAVIHLAALQAPFCRANPPLGAAVNVVGTVNLLEAIADRGAEIGPFVYASSIAAAAQPGELHPSTVYGAYKLACEGVATVYRQERGLASIGLRPHTVYGPGRDQGITSDPTVAMLAAATGTAYEIAFSGRLTMQYAPDVAAAFIAATRAHEYDGAGVFELPGDTVEVATIVAAIEDAAPAAEVSFVGPPLPFPAEVAPDPGSPFGAAVSPTPLSVGVADTVAHFRRLYAADQISAPS